MLKGNNLVGTITIYRLEVRPFTDKQIALVETFAAQAVIAIENTRLLKGARGNCCSSRPPPPTCSRLISRSTFDLRAVLETLVEFRALVRGGHGIDQSPEWRHLLSRRAWLSRSTCWRRIRLRRAGHGVGRTILASKPVQILDVLADPEFTFVGAAKAGNMRTALAVPMLRKG